MKGGSQRDYVLRKTCASAKHMTFMIFVSTIVSLYIRSVWALHARSYGANGEQIGWAIGVAYVLWAIGEIFWPTIGDCIGFDNVMTFTFIPSLLLYFCQAFAGDLTQLIITFLCLFLVTPDFSVGWAYFAKVLPHNKAVQFSSYLHSLHAVGQCLGTVLAGITSFIIGYHSVFIVSGIIALLSFIYCFIFLAFRQKKLIKMQMQLSPAINVNHFDHNYNNNNNNSINNGKINQESQIKSIQSHQICDQNNRHIGNKSHGNLITNGSGCKSKHIKHNNSIDVLQNKSRRSISEKTNESQKSDKNNSIKKLEKESFDNLVSVLNKQQNNNNQEDNEIANEIENTAEPESSEPKHRQLQLQKQQQERYPHQPKHHKIPSETPATPPTPIQLNHTRTFSHEMSSTPYTPRKDRYTRDGTPLTPWTPATFAPTPATQGTAQDTPDAPDAPDTPAAPHIPWLAMVEKEINKEIGKELETEETQCEQATGATTTVAVSASAPAATASASASAVAKKEQTPNSVTIPLKSPSSMAPHVITVAETPEASASLSPMASISPDDEFPILIQQRKLVEKLKAASMSSSGGERKLTSHEIKNKNKNIGNNENANKNKNTDDNENENENENRKKDKEKTRTTEHGSRMSISIAPITTNSDNCSKKKQKKDCNDDKNKNSNTKTDRRNISQEKTSPTKDQKNKETNKEKEPSISESQSQSESQSKSKSQSKSQSQSKSKSKSKRYATVTPRALLTEEMEWSDWLALGLIIFQINIASAGAMLLPSWFAIYMKDRYNSDVLESMGQLAFGLSFLAVGALIAPKLSLFFEYLFVFKLKIQLNDKQVCEIGVMFGATLWILSCLYSLYFARQHWHFWFIFIIPTMSLGIVLVESTSLIYMLQPTKHVGKISGIKEFFTLVGIAASNVIVGHWYDDNILILWYTIIICFVIVIIIGLPFHLFILNGKCRKQDLNYQSNLPTLAYDKKIKIGTTAGIDAPNNNNNGNGNENNIEDSDSDSDSDDNVDDIVGILKNANTHVKNFERLPNRAFKMDCECDTADQSQRLRYEVVVRVVDKGIADDSVTTSNRRKNVHVRKTTRRGGRGEYGTIEATNRFVVSYRDDDEKEEVSIETPKVSPTGANIELPMFSKMLSKSADTNNDMDDDMDDDVNDEGSNRDGVNDIDNDCFWQTKSRRSNPNIFQKKKKSKKSQKSKKKTSKTSETCKKWKNSKTLTKGEHNNRNHNAKLKNSDYLNVVSCSNEEASIEAEASTIAMAIEDTSRSRSDSNINQDNNEHHNHHNNEKECTNNKNNQDKLNVNMNPSPNATPNTTPNTDCSDNVENAEPAILNMKNLHRIQNIYVNESRRRHHRANSGSYCSVGSMSTVSDIYSVTSAGSDRPVGDHDGDIDHDTDTTNDIEHEDEQHEYADEHGDENEDDQHDNHQDNETEDLFSRLELESRTIDCIEEEHSSSNNSDSPDSPDDPKDSKKSKSSKNSKDSKDSNGIKNEMIEN